jgi:electron transfer flavoprotein alpha subunit
LIDAKHTEECWVILESSGGKILRESLEALTAALSLEREHGLPTVGIWAGDSPGEALIEELASMGVGRLISVQGPEGSVPSEDFLVMALKELILKRAPKYLLFGPTPLTSSLAPRLAVHVEGGLVAKATYLRMVDKHVHITRPLLQGRIAEILRISDESPGMISVHPRAFPFVRSSGRKPRDPMERECFDPSRYRSSRHAWRIVASELEPPEALELEDAEVVVAGGKGMGSPTNFDLLQELASLMGGSVAASRIAVDLGWAPKEKLVGQTGKKVAPELYIACGISGAHQHQMGMKESRFILAINTDPGAPIFQKASWGIRGDAPSVVGEMVRLIKAEQESSSAV